MLAHIYEDLHELVVHAMVRFRVEQPLFTQKEESLFWRAALLEHKSNDVDLSSAPDPLVRPAPSFVDHILHFCIRGWRICKQDSVPA
jgi:hypothetical protein